MLMKLIIREEILQTHKTVQMCYEEISYMLLQLVDMEAAKCHAAVSGLGNAAVTPWR